MQPRGVAITKAVSAAWRRSDVHEPFPKPLPKGCQSPGHGDAVLSKTPSCVRGVPNSASPARLPDPRDDGVRFPHARLAASQQCPSDEDSPRENCARGEGVEPWARALILLKESTVVGSPSL